MRLVVVALACVAASCSVSSGAPATTAVSLDAEAGRFCDVVWGWYKTTTGRFNDMSDAARQEPDPSARRVLLFEAFDDFEQASRDLADDVAEFTEGPMATLADQVVADVPASLDAVDEMRLVVEADPEIDEQRPQMRLSQLIILMEKVIDLPKPDITADSDPDLVAAVQAVPACQFAVKGADDGVGRYNG